MFTAACISAGPSGGPPLLAAAAFKSLIYCETVSFVSVVGRGTAASAARLERVGTVPETVLVGGGGIGFAVAAAADPSLAGLCWPPVVGAGVDCAGVIPPPASDLGV